MKQNSSIVILYSELAEYTMSCISALAKIHNEIHVVKWPVNSEAPFAFRRIPGVTLYNREDYDKVQLLELVKSLSPSVIITSGWMDKAYVYCCRKMFGKCPTVMTMDNHWKGDLVQRLKTSVARPFLKKYFSDTWVPGPPQIVFAKNLGFKGQQIKTGFYSADLELFKAEARTEVFKNFLFVGRYLEFKGIKELWQAFINANEASSEKWQLHCAGHGELWDEKTEHPSITHHGFLQPEELKELVKKCDVFILPSHKEPWGVVVHEMAAAGLSLLLSEAIGASSTFLIEGENGFSFSSQDAASLKQSIDKIISLSDQELLAMSKKSQELAELVTPDKWANTVLEFTKS